MPAISDALEPIDIIITEIYCSFEIEIEEVDNKQSSDRNRQPLALLRLYLSKPMETNLSSAVSFRRFNPFFNPVMKHSAADRSTCMIRDSADICQVRFKGSMAATDLGMV